MEKVIETIKQTVEALVNYKLEPDQVPFLVLILITFLALILIPLLAKAINAAKQVENLKDEFQEEYYIELPDMIKVQERTDNRTDNYIIINSSESADANAVYVGEYVLKTDKVELIPSVVRSLRKNGVKIAPHQIEIDKYNHILRQRGQRRRYTDIRNIIDLFSNQPAKFEEYCAEVLRDNGFWTALTPPTRDGGYDIRAYKDGQSYIVECKCYALNHTVGRPLLQKLYGANGSVKADKMLFITTSEFTKTAAQYASEMDIFLIDGLHLMELASVKSSPKTISEDEWGLSMADVQNFVR